jgi:hypothetical protein
MINVIAELERIGWAFDWAGEDEVKCICPFHDDKSPSCAINVKKEKFRCCTAGCGAKGDIVTFISGALKIDRAAVKKELATRYDLNTDRILDVQLIEEYHRNLPEAKPLLRELFKRAVSWDDIKKYRLGVKDGRVTIPIKNASGLYVNIRLYLPGAPGAEKFKNLKGRGSTRLYPVDQMSYSKILVLGGEIKAIVAAAQLNKHGIGCVSLTTGESNWDPKLTIHFKGKERVAVCYDIDDEGVKSQQVACQHLSRVVDTYTCTLPLDKAKHPKGDVNDFVAEKGDMLTVWNEAKPFVMPIKQHLRDEKPKRVDLSKAMTAQCAGKRIAITATVSTLDTSPYVIPSAVTVKCTRDIEECAICPVPLNEPTKVYDIHPESPIILEMIARPKLAQSGAFKEELSIPRACNKCEFEPTTYFNVEDVRVSPRLEITNRSLDRSMQPAVCIGKGVDLNQTYEMIGRMHPHPSTQQSTLLISKYRQSEDALDSHSTNNIDALKVFQPTEWTIDALKTKLDAIYDDLEVNVTQIYGRRSIHIFVDLAYHSPLFIHFEEKQIKGWVEMLIVGDSAQGKSETTMSLMRHYGLGEKIECKNATVAGLLGGLSQMGSRWFVSWGIIPTHDKRLVVLEELKGAHTEVISKLTDMRSSGIAEIPKIEKRRTHARTRIVALSNPRSDNPVSHYNYGVDAIKELVGSLEDIRRFDACLLVSASEIKAIVAGEKVPNTHTGKLCRALILWGWTANKTVFEDDAKDLILKNASLFCETFSEAIPICDRGSMRYKLARLSASLAVRTFSTDENLSVVVRRCHVEFITELLMTVYSSKTFGYLDFTTAIKQANTINDPQAIRKALINTPYPHDLVANLLSRLFIEIQDIQDWCSWDRTTAQDLLSLLVRKHALQRRNRAYVKSSAFISFLKEIDIPNRPSHIPDKKEEF